MDDKQQEKETDDAQTVTLGDSSRSVSYLIQREYNHSD